MHTNSVRVVDPPEQDPRPLIAEWWSEGFRIELRATGNRTAGIVGTPPNEGRQDYGHIDFDAALNRHIIGWSRDGCLALEQYKRDFWDTKFYYAMAEAAR